MKASTMTAILSAAGAALAAPSRTGDNAALASSHQKRGLGLLGGGGLLGTGSVTDTSVTNTGSLLDVNLADGNSLLDVTLLGGGATDGSLTYGSLLQSGSLEGYFCKLGCSVDYAAYTLVGGLAITVDHLLYNLLHTLDQLLFDLGHLTSEMNALFIEYQSWLIKWQFAKYEHDNNGGSQADVDHAEQNMNNSHNKYNNKKQQKEQKQHEYNNKKAEYDCACNPQCH